MSAPTAPTADQTTETIPNWHVRGHVIVACNCDFGCPCNFNGLPTMGKCEGNWNWHIEQGDFGGVSLSGLTVSVAVNWPGPIHEGGGEALIVLDERADPRQRAALMLLLSGKAGGPWQIISGTYAKINGPEYAPYDVAINGYTSRVSAGRYITVQMRPVKNRVTQAEVHPRIILPEGFVFKEGEVGATAKFHVSGGIEFDHSGRYCAVAPFEYIGP